MSFKCRISARRTGHAFSALALAVAASSVLAAEPVSSTSTGGEHVNVVGQAASIDRALKQQRRSDSIKSVVSSDGVAQLPDQNVAEAAQRLPGVSIERDQGEGRFVSVRGLGPDLNSVTINGTQIPSPNSGSRAVALDVLPAELVQSLSVIKTLTPDMDANSLGGTVAVESLSAFDHQGLFYTGTAEGSYDENTSQTSPKFSGAISDRFSLGEGTDNFGVAAAASWGERDFGSDNVETGGNWDFTDGARLEKLEQRDYAISRERAGLGVNFDYQADDLNSYFLRTLYSRYKDTETRNSAGLKFADAQAAGAQGDAEGFRELKDREETQDIQSYVLGSEHLRGPWTFNTQAAWSKSSEDTPGHIAGATFEGNDDFADSGFFDTEKPRLIVDPGFYDPANFSLNEVEWVEQDTSDTEKNLKLDLARDYSLAGNDAQFKFGGKLSQRDKDNDTEVWSYQDFDNYGISDDELLLSGFTRGTVDYSLQHFGPGISADAVKNLLARLDRNEFYDQEQSQVNDYQMSEDINAGYLMHTLDVDDWRLIAGLRYEDTDFSAQGNGVRDGEFEAIEASNNYDHWLPGLHARYQLDDDTQLRAAWTNSVVRPTFEQLAPGFVIDGDEAEFGNPGLDPLESSNFDLGIEHYLGEAGVASAFVFYKDIQNFVYNTDVAGSGAWVDFDQASTFANGDSADLYGLELAYSQKFSMLPAPWNGLLVGANATFSRSEASITGPGSQRDIDLPFQADSVANLMLGWENDKLSLRLSTNYKSDYLYEVAAVNDQAHDQFVDAQTHVDFTARYFLTDELQLSFEAQNLTDQPYYLYSGNSSYNAQYEEYGPSYKLGLTFTHF